MTDTISKKDFTLNFKPQTSPEEEKNERKMDFPDIDCYNAWFYFLEQSGGG
jgi:hypothetical protein